MNLRDPSAQIRARDLRDTQHSYIVAGFKPRSDGAVWRNQTRAEASDYHSMERPNELQGKQVLTPEAARWKSAAAHAGSAKKFRPSALTRKSILRTVRKTGLWRSVALSFR